MTRTSRAVILDDHVTSDTVALTKQLRAAAYYSRNDISHMKDSGCVSSLANTTYKLLVIKSVASERIPHVIR